MRPTKRPCLYSESERGREGRNIDKFIISSTVSSSMFTLYFANEYYIHVCCRLGFSDVKYVAAFKEYELELMVEDVSALISLIEGRLAGSATYSDYVPNA
jgi:hypothetical protein